MIVLLLRLALDPSLASHVGAALAGHPDLGAVLERVCTREAPGCTMVGLHSADRWMSERAWRAAVRVGWLDPQRCRWHRLEAGPWSTSGPWGQARAYAMRHLPCVPVIVLDVPIVGAFVAARRAASRVCDGTRRCRSWRGHHAR